MLLLVSILLCLQLEPMPLPVRGDAEESHQISISIFVNISKRICKLWSLRASPSCCASVSQKSTFFGSISFTSKSRLPKLPQTSITTISGKSLKGFYDPYISKLLEASSPYTKNTQNRSEPVNKPNPQDQDFSLPLTQKIYNCKEKI